jgi:hypothetical protein
MNIRNHNGRPQWRPTALAIALGLTFSGAALAQSNASGAIFGQVSAPAGSTILLQNTDTGLTRTIPVDSSGRYRASSLPIGHYTVSLQRDGATVKSRENVVVTVSGGVDVSFDEGAQAAQAQNLEGISVVASALPSIDVSSVDTRTVLTSEQLSKVPVARDITAAALLAPGTVAGDSRYGNVASFGGASASENAYYINGYAVTNPLTSLGSTTLPFDAIDQEQVLTGGYGAEFGRSNGGVINIVTKRGSNEWKGGVTAYWVPSALRANARTIYYPSDTGAGVAGTVYQYRTPVTNTSTTYGAYVGGPLIKDRLFIYTSAEMEKRNGSSVGARLATASNNYNDYTLKVPRWMAKVDWNINDNNIVEFTGISDKTGETDNYYAYDYNTYTHGTTKNGGYRYKDGGELYIGKYTGYITDNLTITALYGTQKQVHYSSPAGYDPSQVYVRDDRPIANPVIGLQPYLTIADQNANDKTDGWRLDLEYRLGSHDIRLGYDKQNLQSETGSTTSGPGYAWFYAQAGADGAVPSSGGLTTAPNGDYVYRYVVANGGTFKVQQAAQYIEDRWQISDRWLASLGLRNEQFTNLNSDGVPYARQRHQLAPRLGISWDVFGDSTLKVFANAGRYHLSMPNNVAARGAAGSTLTSEFFTFQGIDPVTGVPQGTVALGNGPYAPNNEYGQAKDPRTVAASSLKSQYQDEYILCAEKQLTPAWNAGAKLTYRKLRSAIDDMCDPRAGIKWAEDRGIDPYLPGGIADSFFSCRLFNPGVGNTFLIDDGTGTLQTIKLSAKDLGFPKLKRKYYALDLFLEHPFDGKWYGKVSYTYAKNYGNSEGQLDSDLGQRDVSQTVTWDHVELMQYGGGNLPNDRKHALKAYGYYQLTPEWLVGSSLIVNSGRPRNCLGYLQGGSDFFYNNLEYGPYYHFCNGKPSPRGTAGRLPWDYQLGLSAAYRPAFANHNLELKLDVFNVTNRQVAQNAVEISELGGSGVAYSQRGRVISYSAPRYVRFTARYDFSL